MNGIKRLGNYKGIVLPKHEITVTEQEVEQEVERAVSLAATQIDKETEEAEAGDTAVIDFIGYIDGEAFPGGDGESYPLVLGSGSFIPGFEEQLIGHKKGDSVDVNVTFPVEYHAPEYAGKDAIFKVTVKNIQSTSVPELSDEVIQKVSGIKTVEEFRKYVHEQISNKKTEELAIENENYVLTKIVEDSEIEISDEAVEERAGALKNSLEAQLRNSGQTLEAYLQYNGINAEEYDTYAKRDALNMLKGQAVLGAIAEAEGYECTEADLEEELKNVATAYQMETDKLKEMMGQDGMNLLRQDVLSKRALELIMKLSIK